MCLGLSPLDGVALNLLECRRALAYIEERPIFMCFHNDRNKVIGLCTCNGSVVIFPQSSHGPRGAMPLKTCVDIVTIFPVDGKLIFSLFVDWDAGGCILGARYDFMSTGICQLGSGLLRFVDWGSCS